MIYCHVNVIMTGFTPSATPGMPAEVTATLELTEQTPNPKGAPYFTMKNGNLSVDVPKGTPARVEYSLVNQTGSSDIFYICGMFFTNPPAKVEDDIGTFPLVLIAQDVPVKVRMEDYEIQPAPYTTTVVDQNSRPGFWEYTICIQDLNTAVIGLLDPGVQNDE